MLRNVFIYRSLALIILLALSSLFLTSCLDEDQLHRQFTTFTPQDIGDGWLLSTPTAEGIDSLSLVRVYKDVYNHKKAWTLRSMLVIRNGKLVAESYFKGDEDRYRYNAVWSCTKQVTGIMTGIAINEGFIHSVNDSLKDYLDQELIKHPDKKDITIKQLLTMKSGIEFNETSDTYKLLSHATDDCVDFVLGKPLKWSPGTHYQYDNGTPQILSAIIRKQTGKSLEQYTNEKLFSKIGLSKYTWVNYPGGITLSAFGLAMPSRELAKIAQCICNSGMNNSEQIIPANWLPQMLYKHVPYASGSNSFGYYWWINNTGDIVFMAGLGGQYAMIKPSSHLVVVFTSIEHLTGDLEFSRNDALYFTERISQLIE